MAAELNATWKNDPQYMNQLLELTDRLHRARMYAASCDEPAPTVCGLLPVGRRPCAAYRQQQAKFPEAMCILGPSGSDGQPAVPDGGLPHLFDHVRRNLGLLQAHILYTHLESGRHGEQYKLLRHLETGVGLMIPWLRPRSGDPTHLEPDPRSEGIFKAWQFFREAFQNENQQFIRVLLPRGNGNEPALPPPGGKHARPFLSPEEDDANLLVVADTELTFFSLLFVLAQARSHARNRGQLGLLEHWLVDNEVHLQAEMCHTHPRLDGGGPDPDAGDEATTWLSEDFYWRSVSFPRAMYALGLTTAPRGDGAVTTDRFSRLSGWLREEALKLPGATHPALRCTVHLAGRPLPLLETLFPEGPEPGPCATAQESLDGLRTLCRRVFRRLPGVSVDSAASIPLLESAHLFRGFPGVRFNLPGEYLLNKFESGPRAFFAMPLGYLRDTESSLHQVATFALGTLLDLPGLAPSTLPRLRAVRLLLRTFADFGTDHAQTQYFSAHARNEERWAVLQSLHDSFHVFQMDIEDHNEDLRRCQQHCDVPLPLLPSPDALAFMMMIVKAMKLHELLELPKACADMLLEPWNESLLEKLIDRMVWPEARHRVLADPAVVQGYREGRVRWEGGIGGLERKFPRPVLRVDVKTTPEPIRGVYPWLVLALRKSYRHSYLGTLLTAGHPRGAVEVVYHKKEKTIEVLNTGREPDGNARQYSWKRHLDIFKDVSNGWCVADLGGSRFTRFDRDGSRWVTHIVHGNQGAAP